MRRFIYEKLLEWKALPERKPLMMYGARQVGKTFTLREFGKNEFRDLVYINCYRNEEVAKIFQGDANVGRLLLGLSAVAKKNIEEGKTLLFLDEVQEVPQAVSSLKYFCEERPGLHVAVAGSLLGVMNMKGESFPVGKVDILRMYPMAFEEFLLALGEERLLELLRGGDFAALAPFESKLTEYLREYYFVGGMPEAVSRFASDKNLKAVRKIQRNILEAYEADISKHSAAETQRIRMVWQSIPSQLAKENKKFLFGAVKKGARAKDLEIAIQWLVDAGLVYKVERSRGAKMPLKFYADSSAFKLYLLDVGLLGAMAGIEAAQVLVQGNFFSEYKGAFTENYVIQAIRRLELPAYYYSKDNSTQEVDFLVQLPERLLPVEVKAEMNVKSKSLAAFVNDFRAENLKPARFSMKPYADQGWMENVPLYAIGKFLEG